MLADDVISFLNEIFVNAKVFFWMGYSKIFHKSILLSIIHSMDFSNFRILLLKLGL